jgi:hypothetical protein
MVVDYTFFHFFESASRLAKTNSTGEVAVAQKYDEIDDPTSNLSQAIVPPCGRCQATSSPLRRQDQKERFASVMAPLTPRRNFFICTQPSLNQCDIFDELQIVSVKTALIA